MQHVANSICAFQPALPPHNSWPSKDLRSCILLSKGSCNVLKLGKRALRQGFVSWLIPGAQCIQHPAVLHACRAA